MRTSGVVGYGQKAWSTTKSYSNKGLAYLEASYPDYYKTASTWGRQYAKLTGDFYLVGRNFVFKLYNNTAEFVEQKKPIVVDSVSYLNIFVFINNIIIDSVNIICMSIYFSID